MTTNNDVTPEKKSSILKSLAVIGFIGIIILLAWLSVQLVKVAPGAFSSLASLAESVYQTQGKPASEVKVAPLTVTNSATVVSTGDPVEINWGATDTPGTYTFSYACADGLAVDLNNVEGVKSIACDTNYNVGNVTTLSLSVDSEKTRYAELSYTVSFLKTNATEPSATGTAAFTVVNSDISSLATSDNEPATEPEKPAVTEPTTETTAVVPTETTTVTPPLKTPPASPAYEQEYVYTIPTSDPNGRTDLSPRFLNVGKIVNNTFFAGQAKATEAGAIQFEVKNYGTKTSASWTFSVALPNGETYQSAPEAPLKPNERAVITVGFPATSNKTFTFKVSVSDITDRNTVNDQFVQTVNFI